MASMEHETQGFTEACELDHAMAGVDPQPQNIAQEQSCQHQQQSQGGHGISGSGTASQNMIFQYRDDTGTWRDVAPSLARRLAVRSPCFHLIPFPRTG